MSIRYKLLNIFLLTICSVLALGWYAHSINLKYLSQEQDIRSNSNRIIEFSYQAKSLFNIQIGAWKNMLLRGNEQGNYHTYLQKYYEAEREARAVIQELQGRIDKEDESYSLSVQLVEQHLFMGRKFRQALQVFNSTDVNPGEVTDKFVAGVEEKPTELLDSLLATLSLERKSKIQEIEQQREKNQAYLIFIIGVVALFLLGVFLWLLDANIAKPAQQAAHLANLVKHAEIVANFGTWGWNIKNNSHFWSDNFYKIFSFDKYAVASFDQFLAGIIESDRERIKTVINKSISNHSTFETEAKIQSTAGMKERVVLLRGDVIIAGEKGGKQLTCIAHDITDLKEMQKELNIKERAMESALEGILLLELKDNNYSIIYANQSIEALTGYTHDELVGANLNMLRGPETEEDLFMQINKCITELNPLHTELLAYRKNGTTFYDEITLTPVNDGTGVISHFICTQMDVTDRRKSEENLRRTQKMDAIGQLAGGVAHDFNNQLAIVIGYLDTLGEHLENDPTAMNWVKTASQATERCINLTKQLLIFSRHKAKESNLINLNNELTKIDALIRKFITAAITLKVVTEENLWLVDSDPGEFQDAVINLVINARDAMTHGGQLIIETANKFVYADQMVSNKHLAPGEYVQISVSDSGRGIGKKDLERIFEPFFTTKPEGKGTGLGLAMVYGFAKRYFGDIKVYSEPGVGTTFIIYLPRSRADTDNKSIESQQKELNIGSETILIVDDEEELLSLAESYLNSLGYRTLTATNAHVALEVLKSNPHIKLLFSDVVMPGKLNGYDLAEQAVKIYPDLKVLLTSGFTASTMAVNGQARFDANLLHKPYRKHDLAQHIRLALEN